jgi:uncharacterized oxidoreductase
MKYITAAKLQQIGTLLLDAAGSPHEESEIVSEILVRSSLVGHDSHGIWRFTHYIGLIKAGQLKPGAPFEIERETRAMAVVNGHQGWGPVVARKAMQLAIDKARAHCVGTVVIRGSQHIGRVGEYPPLAVAEQMIGLAVVNSHGGGESVAPWGGIDRRFTPNPIAFAAPSGEAWPVLVDMTASVIPEGKVRYALYQGVQLPAGCIIDHAGNPITDPATFYGPPPGALLPLGGIAGYKGYGLAVITELLGGALSGAGCNGQPMATPGNGVFFQAINIADFLPVEQFIKTVQELMAWVKSSRKSPGVDEILFPGEPEYRTAQQRRQEGIPVADSVWAEMLEAADELGVQKIDDT